MANTQNNELYNKAMRKMRDIAVLLSLRRTLKSSQDVLHISEYSRMDESQEGFPGKTVSVWEERACISQNFKTVTVLLYLWEFNLQSFRSTITPVCVFITCYTGDYATS